MWLWHKKQHFQRMIRQHKNIDHLQVLILVWFIHTYWLKRLYNLWNQEQYVWIWAGKTLNLVLPRSLFLSLHSSTHTSQCSASIPLVLRVLLSDLPPLTHASFDPAPSHTSILCPSLSLLYYSFTSSLPLLPLPYSYPPPPSLQPPLLLPSIWK